MCLHRTSREALCFHGSRSGFEVQTRFPGPKPVHRYPTETKFAHRFGDRIADLPREGERFTQSGFSILRVEEHADHAPHLQVRLLKLHARPDDRHRADVGQDGQPLFRPSLVGDHVREDRSDPRQERGIRALIRKSEGGAEVLLRDRGIAVG